MFCNLQPHNCVAMLGIGAIGNGSRWSRIIHIHVTFVVIPGTLAAANLTTALHSTRVFIPALIAICSTGVAMINFVLFVGNVWFVSAIGWTGSVACGWVVSETIGVSIGVGTIKITATAGVVVVSDDFDKIVVAYLHHFLYQRLVFFCIPLDFA